MAQAGARIGDDARRERTRHLIQCGGLVAKAGLDGLTETQLLGGLCELRDLEQGYPAVLARWDERGRTEMAASRAPKRVPATARFWRRLEAHESESVRALGFRWDRELGAWRGAVSPDEARPFIESLGGEFGLD